MQGTLPTFRGASERCLRALRACRENGVQLQDPEKRHALDRVQERPTPECIPKEEAVVSGFSASCDLGELALGDDDLLKDLAKAEQG